MAGLRAGPLGVRHRANFGRAAHITVMDPNKQNRQNPQLTLTPDVTDRVAKGALTWTLRRLVSEAIRELYAVAVEWGTVIAEWILSLCH